MLKILAEWQSCGFWRVSATKRTSFHVYTPENDHINLTSLLQYPLVIKMTLLRGNKEEKNMRRQVKVEKNNRQTNK